MIVVVVSLFIGRNLIRLWLAPRSEASGKNATMQTLVGLLFVVLSTGPLVESARWSTKPLGAAVALIGVLLITLGVRDGSRAAGPRGRKSRKAEARGVVRS